MGAMRSIHAQGAFYDYDTQWLGRHGPVRLIRKTLQNDNKIWKEGYRNAASLSQGRHSCQVPRLFLWAAEGSAALSDDHMRSLALPNGYAVQRH